MIHALSFWSLSRKILGAEGAQKFNHSLFQIKKKIQKNHDFFFKKIKKSDFYFRNQFLPNPVFNPLDFFFLQKSPIKVSARTPRRELNFQIMIKILKILPTGTSKKKSSVGGGKDIFFWKMTHLFGGTG